MVHLERPRPLARFPDRSLGGSRLGWIVGAASRSPARDRSRDHARAAAHRTTQAVILACTLQSEEDGLVLCFILVRDSGGGRLSSSEDGGTRLAAFDARLADAEA